jgi:SAM-dependent methyltransferase
MLPNHGSRDLTGSREERIPINCFVVQFVLWSGWLILLAHRHSASITPHATIRPLPRPVKIHGLAPNWNLYGIEISEALAEKARKLSGAQVFGGDVLEAPFESESFDVVTAFDVLEHLHQPKKTAERVWNWLKPGGIFYLVLPNIRSWEARTFHSYWFGLELPRHLYHFSPASLRRLLTFAGFKEESLTTPVCTYVEHSTNYVLDDVFAKLGVARAPLVDRKLPTFFWRIIRKGLRLTALSFVAEVASVCGAGPSIEAVFRKD